MPHIARAVRYQWVAAASGGCSNQALKSAASCAPRRRKVAHPTLLDRKRSGSEHSVACIAVILRAVMTALEDPRFAVVLPIGPSPGDLGRANAVLASLVAWEPLVRWCIIVEDDEARTALADSAIFPSSCDTIAVKNPRRGCGYGRTGGLCAGILTALAWIHQHTDVAFVLKLDTDAFVIGRFGHAVASYLAKSPETGIVGTLGISCHPDLRPLQDPRREPDLLRLRRLLPQAPSGGGLGENVRIDGLGLVPLQLVHAFAAVRPHVDRAVANGYATSEYCQGGGYAISREMLKRMAGLGYLAQPEPWIWLPVGEDMAMAMYARAVGLELRDFSSPGQVFAIQAGGLAYPPPELLKLGYSIVHSVRSDPLHAEAAIVEFFRANAERDVALKPAYAPVPPFDCL